MNSTLPLRRSLGRTLAAAVAASRAWRALLALLIVAVSCLALVPKPPTGIDLGWDKLNHMLAFTALAIAAWLAFPARLRTRLFSLCVLLAFGGLIEILQLSVPGRSAEWADLFADALDIGLGAAIAFGVLHTIASAPKRAARL